MKVAFINMTYEIGSTGKIVKSIENKLKEEGNNSISACAVSKFLKQKNSNVYIVKSLFGYYASICLTRFLGGHGFYDRYATRNLIRWLEKEKPDLIHLHNIHGFYLNVECLFDYLKTSGIPVVWTLHDCWSITGHCASFDCIRCSKWKNGCDDCPQLRCYPITYFDSSKKNYKRKKNVFTSLDKDQLTLVTPSKWLKCIIEESYLFKYRIDVIPNGIDTDVFKPYNTNMMSDQQKKYKVLAVSFGYNERKGLLDLNELSKLLGKNYQITIVGVGNEYRDRFNKEITLIPKTINEKELAEYYSDSDVYVNLTKEEVFGMVNLESQACGTPVVSYMTGGCPECIDIKYGEVVEKNNIELLAEAIKRVCTNSRIDQQSIRNYVLENFTSEIMAKRYCELYYNILSNRN